MPAFLSKVTADGAAIWEELVEPNPSPVFNATRESLNITRQFRVSQADMQTFITECYPPGSRLTGRHPLYQYLFVNDVNGVPAPGHTIIDTPTGHSEPDYFVISVTYTPYETQSQQQGGPPNTAQAQDILTGSVSFTTDTMTLPGYGLKWATGSVAIKEPEVQPFLLIPVSQWSIQVPRARAIPWAAMRASRGRINASAFWGAAPETVLYTGMNVQYRFSSDGTRQYDLEHHFQEKQIVWGNNVYGWNHFYDSSNKRWDKILNDDGAPLYTPVNTFDALLA